MEASRKSQTNVKTGKLKSNQEPKQIKAEVDFSFNEPNKNQENDPYENSDPNKSKSKIIEIKLILFKI